MGKFVFLLGLWVKWKSPGLAGAFLIGMLLIGFGLRRFGLDRKNVEILVAGVGRKKENGLRSCPQPVWFGCLG
jgi:hypothetical protein